MGLYTMSVIDWMVAGEVVGEWIFCTSSHLFDKSKTELRSTGIIGQFTLHFKKQNFQSLRHILAK